MSVFVYHVGAWALAIAGAGAVFAAVDFIERGPRK